MFSSRLLPARVVLPVTLALTVACSRSDVQARAPSGPLILSSIVLLGTNERGHMMSVTRVPLPLDTGASVNNCIDYLKARAAGANAKDDAKAAELTAEYMICDALDAVQKAKPLQHAPREDLGQQVATRLDLRTALPEGHPRLTSARNTLGQFGSAVTNDAVTTRAKDGYGHLRLEVIAQADFTGDKKLDWLVWMIDEPTRGHPSYKTLVIENVVADGLLQAKEYRPAT